MGIGWGIARGVAFGRRLGGESQASQIMKMSTCFPLEMSAHGLFCPNNVVRYEGGTEILKVPS